MISYLLVSFHHARYTFFPVNKVYGQGDGNGDLGEIIHSELICPELAARVAAFWKDHPLAETAGVSLCGSEGETIVVETLDARTSRCEISSKTETSKKQILKIHFFAN